MLRAVEQLEAALHDRLGLRARHQGTAIDRSVEAPEPPLTEHVLEWLARARLATSARDAVELAGESRRSMCM